MSADHFSTDPLTGISTFIEFEGGKLTVHNTQDCAPILELNKKKQSAGRAYYAADPDMWRVASIPILVQYEWALKYGIDDVTSDEHWPRVRRLLNSNEYRYLKTAEVII